MSKIIVEDKSFLPHSKEYIIYLATNIMIGASQVGLSLKMTDDEIIEALILAGKNMGRHFKYMDVMTDEQINELERSAEEKSIDSFNKMKENGKLDELKKVYKKIQEEKIKQ